MFIWIDILIVLASKRNHQIVKLDENLGFEPEKKLSKFHPFIYIPEVEELNSCDIKNNNLSLDYTIEFSKKLMDKDKTLQSIKNSFNDENQGDTTEETKMDILYEDIVDIFQNDNIFLETDKKIKEYDSTLKIPSSDVIAQREQSYTFDTHLTLCDKLLKKYLYLLRLDKMRSLSINSKTVYKIESGLFKSFKICKITRKIERDSLFRFYYCILALKGKFIKGKILERYRKKINCPSFCCVNDFIKDYILDNVLNPPFRLEIPKKAHIQICENEQDCLFLFKTFIEDMINNYKGLFGGFPDKFKIQKEFRCLNLQEILEIFKFDLCKFFMPKKNRVLLYLFPEIVYLISQFDHSKMSINNYRQIFAVINYIIFKFSLLKKNFLIDLLEAHVNSNNDFFKSELFSKFVLTTRAILYITYTQVYKKNLNKNAEIQILLHLFINFLRVRRNDIFCELIFDEFWFLNLKISEVEFLKLNMKKITMHINKSQIDVMTLFYPKIKKFSGFIKIINDFQYKIFVENFYKYSQELQSNSPLQKYNIMKRYKEKKTKLYRKILKYLNL
ncbi:hypothetical protein TUBRATIS_20420 [Tubulinosema ratisbonensis]|uniref:Uncharacterized protein n=1 Tax=Tubulinosema ratisbonensis TaxID=291195 RepID=A0A437AK39_9MICR|nr:hypothetical protein TUBRATIS_20420 [Tubulinosema ratisbonensis]